MAGSVIELEATLTIISPIEKIHCDDCASPFIAFYAASSQVTAGYCNECSELLEHCRRGLRKYDVVHK